MITVNNTTPGYKEPEVKAMPVTLNVEYRPEPLLRLYQEVGSGSYGAIEFQLRLDSKGGLDLIVIDDKCEKGQRHSYYLKPDVLIEALLDLHMQHTRISASTPSAQKGGSHD